MGKVLNAHADGDRGARMPRKCAPVAGGAPKAFGNGCALDSLGRFPILAAFHQAKTMVRPSKDNGEERERKPENAFAYAHVGLQFAGVFLLFFAIGYWADKRWETAPWLTLSGAALGFGAGMYYLIRTVK